MGPPHMLSFVVTALLLQSSDGLAAGQGFGAKKKAKKKIKVKKTKFVRPSSERRKAGFVGPSRVVPESILRPDYALSGTPGNSDQLRLPWMIETKSSSDVEKMRVAGRVAREVLDLTGRAVRPGITTDELDEIAHAAIIERGAYPSPLNYHGFPKSICTSVNEVICHGIPDAVALQSGDIINLDVTVYLDGFHGDCSEMFFVGLDDQEDLVDEASRTLVQVTYDAWQAAIAFCKPGRAYKDIGAVIEDYITPYGYQSVKQFCGHGIGRLFHTSPNVLHVRNNEPNGVMKPGHTFTIEPMICEGTQESDLWPDAWTAVTKDLGRSAQFEHTLLITEDGVEPLTKKLPTSPLQPWEVESSNNFLLPPELLVGQQTS